MKSDAPIREKLNAQAEEQKREMAVKAVRKHARYLAKGRSISDEEADAAVELMRETEDGSEDLDTLEEATGEKRKSLLEDEGLTSFMKQIGQIERLTDEEERGLVSVMCKRRADYEATRWRMLLHMLPKAIPRAKKFSNPEIDQNELTKVAWLTIIQFVSSFDIDQCGEFFVNARVFVDSRLQRKAEALKFAQGNAKRGDLAGLVNDFGTPLTVGELRREVNKPPKVSTNPELEEEMKALEAKFHGVLKKNTKDDYELVAELSKRKGDFLVERDRLIESKIPMALSLVKKFRKSGLPPLDLLNEALLGLTEFLESHEFDARKNFSTLAYRAMEDHSRKAISKIKNVIQTPEHVLRAHAQIERAQKNLEQRLGRTTTIEEVASNLGIKPETVANRLAAVPTVVPLEQVDQEGERLPDESILSPLERIKGESDRQACQAMHGYINEVLARLSDREEKVLRLSLGIDFK